MRKLLLPIIALIMLGSPFPLLGQMYIDSVDISPDPVTEGNSVTVDVALSFYYGDSQIAGFWWTLAGVSSGYVSTNSTGDGSFTCTPPGTGTYWVQITPADINSNSYTTENFSFQSVAANVAPTISSMSHSPTSPLTGNSVTVTITGSDANGTADLRRTYTWYKKPSGSTVSGSWGYVSNTSDRTTTYTFTPSDDGTYTVYSRFYDDSGAMSSTSSRTITVTAPNNPPSVDSISASPSSGTVGNSTTFTFTCSDPDGNAALDYVDCEIRNTTNATVSSGTGTFSYSGDRTATHSWTPSSAGTYTVRAYAYDDGGARSVLKTLSYTVLEPEYPPQVDYINSYPSSWAQGQETTIRINCSDPNGPANLNRVYRYIRTPSGSSTASRTDYFSSMDPDDIRFDFTPTQVGKHTVYVTVYDDNGNTATGSQEFFVNATPYITGIATNPSTTDTGSTVNVTVTAADGNGIADLYRVDRYVKDPDGITLASGSDYFSHNYDNTTDFSFVPTKVGTYTISARVIDDKSAYSGYTSTTLNVTAPNAAPSISMYGFPESMSVDESESAFSVPVLLTADDIGENDIVSIQLLVDGVAVDAKNYSPASGPVEHEMLSFSISSGFSGSKSISAVVTDSGGKTASVAQTFTVNRAPPVTYIEGTFYIRGWEIKQARRFARHIMYHWDWQILDPVTKQWIDTDGRLPSPKEVQYDAMHSGGFIPVLADYALDTMGSLFHDKIESLIRPVTEDHRPLDLGGWQGLRSASHDSLESFDLAPFLAREPYDIMAETRLINQWTAPPGGELPGIDNTDKASALGYHIYWTGEVSKPTVSASVDLGDGVTLSYTLVSEVVELGRNRRFDWAVTIGGEDAALLPPDIAVGQVWTDQHYMVTYTNQDPNNNLPYLQWYSRYYDDATAAWIEYEAPDTHWTDPSGWGVTNEYFGWSLTDALPGSYFEIWARTFTLTPANESQWVLVSGRVSDRPLRHTHALKSGDGTTTYAEGDEIPFEVQDLLLDAAVFSNTSDTGASDGDVGYALFSYRLTDKDGTVGSWVTLTEQSDAGGVDTFSVADFAIPLAQTTTTIEIMIDSNEIDPINAADTGNALTEIFTYTRDANRPPFVTWVDGHDDDGDGTYQPQTNLNETDSFTVNVWFGDPDDNAARVRARLALVNPDNSTTTLTEDEYLTDTGADTHKSFEVFVPDSHPGKYRITVWVQDRDGAWCDTPMWNDFYATKSDGYLVQAELNSVDLLEVMAEAGEQDSGEITVHSESVEPCGWGVTVTEMSYAIPALHDGSTLFEATLTGLASGQEAIARESTWDWKAQAEAMTIQERMNYVGNKTYDVVVTVTNSLGMTSTLMKDVTIRMSDPYRDAVTKPLHLCGNNDLIYGTIPLLDWFTPGEGVETPRKVAHSDLWKDDTVPDVVVQGKENVWGSLEKDAYIPRALWPAIQGLGRVYVRYRDPPDPDKWYNDYPETEVGSGSTKILWENLSPSL